MGVGGRTTEADVTLSGKVLTLSVYVELDEWDEYESIDSMKLLLYGNPTLTELIGAGRACVQGYEARDIVDRDYCPRCVTEREDWPPARSLRLTVAGVFDKLAEYLERGAYT